MLKRYLKNILLNENARTLTSNLFKNPELSVAKKELL
jgi:hypothetical protein